MKSPLLEIKDLVVGPECGGPPVVNQVSLAVRPGEVLALIGASGSGKTTVSLSALGHFRSGLRARSGQVLLDGIDLLTLPETLLGPMRGRIVSYVAQSAAAAFNPAFRLEKQLIEPSLLKGTRSRSEALALTKALFRRMNLPDPDAIGRRYPHEVSGGQLQRFMIAMALVDNPKLIVFDEPTSALDVTTQLEVLILIKDVIREYGTAAIFVSHDLPVVAQMADRILVLRGGEAVEEGGTDQILLRPAQPYTCRLLDAFRKRSEPVAPIEAFRDESPLLEVHSASISYGGVNGTLAVDHADLKIWRGEVSAVVGESGSGKTTLAKMVAGLESPQGGSITFDGRPIAGLASARSAEDKRRIQMVFQSADTVLNPAHTIRKTLERALTFYWQLSNDALDARVSELLMMVGLTTGHATRRPAQLSGGEKQRVNLARALAAKPDVLICDEVTSALDVVVALDIIDLIRTLCRDMRLGVLFISHDLASLGPLADDINVMFFGKLVEQGPAKQILRFPQNDCTKTLLQSIPELRSDWLTDIVDQRAIEQGKLTSCL